MVIYNAPNTTIYKYPFNIGDTVILRLPAGAEVIKWDVQNGVPYVWAKVNPDNPWQDQRFQLRGTGHPLGEVGKHLATFFHGPFVWHVFALAKEATGTETE
jgi:hypothetical protein